MILHFMDLDQLYYQMYMRASDPNTIDEEAKKFQKRCHDFGVPTIALRNLDYVRAARTAGYGSPQMRAVRSQRMLPYMGMLPESGRYNWIRDEIISIAGPENLDRYFPEQKFPTHDQWEANVENGLMHAGQHVMIADGQNHAVHADVHLTSLEAMIQMANSLYQNSPVDSGLHAMVKLQMYGQIETPHINAHMQLLANDRVHQQQFRALQTRLGSLVNVFRQVDAIVEQGQERQQRLGQQQQTAQTEDQIKMQSAQNEMQIERAMAASKIRNQALKTQSQIETAQAKANQKIIPMRQQLQMETAQQNAALSPVQPVSPQQAMGAGMGGASPEDVEAELPMD